MFKKLISKLTSIAGTVAMLSLLLSLTGIAFGTPTSRVSATVQYQGVVSGGTANVAAPERFVPAYSNAAPVASASQLAASQAWMQKVQAARFAHGQAQPHNSNTGSPDGGSPTRGLNSIQPQAAGDFTIFENTKLTPPAGYAGSVMEPAHAQQGKNVFYTGNWFAAHSMDGGATWSYINPYADFTNFCCDQDVAQDPARTAMFWWRQGVVPGGGTQNKDKLSVSTDGGATFLTYSFFPTDVNGAWTNQWFDYPHLAVSNNYLYITTNMFDTTSGNFLRMLLLRFPLGPMLSGSGFSYNYWYSTTGWSWTTVQGATTTMYLGDTYDQSTSDFRLFTLPESSGTMTYVDRTITGWTFTNGNASCPLPNAVDPCGRADQRITDGWVANGVIGFFWNVAQGGGFPYPYVESATFDTATQAYQTRPYIWSSGTAWQYGTSAPNVRGDLGIGVFGMGNGSYPYFCVGIDDDFNGTPPGWEINCPVVSNSWVDNNDGDYLRVRPFVPEGTFWTASAYNYQTGTGTYNPKYIVFGRGRDTNAWNRWHNQ